MLFDSTNARQQTTKQIFQSIISPSLQFSSLCVSDSYCFALLINSYKLNNVTKSGIFTQLDIHLQWQ